VERIIYDRYRVMVIGSVPIKMQLRNSQEIETCKLAFSSRRDRQNKAAQTAEQEVRRERTDRAAPQSTIAPAAIPCLFPP
jgi:hypothetical protein